jgi:hypothetical protein
MMSMLVPGIGPDGKVDFYCDEFGCPKTAHDYPMALPKCREHRREMKQGKKPEPEPRKDPFTEPRESARKGHRKKRRGH